MLMKSQIVWFLFLLSASVVCGQSQSQCPANSAMGLCVDVPQPCFNDMDCYNGEICCPEACARTCKPRNSKTGFLVDSSVPDLLNDPRVYIGKCPEASCFSLFGAEPNECSTSKLCPEEQICCNDGCRNVCQWKPQVAAFIAKEQARARHRQQLLIQKQQEEMKRRQQEMYLQQQRQIAAAELARKQQEARAAAEAELMAQQMRAKYEASLRALAGTRAKSENSLRQSKPQQEYKNDIGVGTTPYQVVPSSQGSLDNIARESPPIFSSNSGTHTSAEPQPQPRFPQSTMSSSRGTVSNKRNNFQVSHINQIQSPANLNPYSLLQQQSVYSKTGQSDLMSLIQSAPPILTKANKINGNGTANSQRSRLAQKLYSAFRNLESFGGFPRRNVPHVNQVEIRPVFNNYAAQQRPHSYTQRATGHQTPPTYPTQNQLSSYTSYRAPPPYPIQFHDNQSQSSFPYTHVNQYSASSLYRQQQRQASMSPFFMYQAMQSAA